MNLFRSEEHVRKWARFDPSAEGGIISLADLVKLFSESLFRRRMDADYASRFPAYLGEMIGAVGKFAETHPFWKPIHRTEKTAAP